MNYLGVWEFISVSFEIFPPKLKKFENSLKLPGVLFSISLIIYNKEAKAKAEAEKLAKQANMSELEKANAELADWKAKYQEKEDLINLSTQKDETRKIFRI